MKSSLALAAVAVTVALAGCGDRTESAKEAPKIQPAASAEPPASPGVVATTPSPAARSAPPDSPAFAELYPNAKVEGAPVMADGPTGPGGMVTFTTDDAPDAVVAFYKQRAEAAGLAPMMALNTGATRGYGAIRQETGASVNVVASPADEGSSVQLTWSVGQ